jgi:hypothetical protein
LDDFFGYLHNLGSIRLQHNVVSHSNHLLFRVFEIAGLLRLRPQILDRVEHVLGLSHIRQTQSFRPNQVLIHHGNQIRKLRDFLDVVVPGLVFQFGNVVGVLHKARRLHDLQRIGGRGQNDGDERIGMQRDGLSQLFQFGLAKLRRARGRRRGVWLRR